MRGGIVDEGLAADVINGLAAATNRFVCPLIGPNALNIVLTKNNCPSGIILPTLFHSYKDLCAFYNRASANTQMCMTKGLARTAIDIPGIVNYDEVVGSCCRSCA